MNWNAIGAVGEVAGAIGVIITLVYLAVQIRQNTRAIKGSAARESLDILTAVQIPLYTTTQAASVYRKGLFESSSLSPDERMQFEMGTYQIFAALELYFFQSRDGLIDRRIFERQMSVMDNLLACPGVREFLSAASNRFDPTFNEFVVDRMAHGDVESVRDLGRFQT